MTTVTFPEVLFKRAPHIADVSDSAYWPGYITFRCHASLARHRCHGRHRQAAGARKNVCETTSVFSLSEPSSIRIEPRVTLKLERSGAYLEKRPYKRAKFFIGSNPELTTCRLHRVYLRRFSATVLQWTGSEQMPYDQLVEVVKSADALFCLLRDRIDKALLDAG